MKDRGWGWGAEDEVWDDTQLLEVDRNNIDIRYEIY